MEPAPEEASSAPQPSSSPPSSLSPRPRSAFLHRSKPSTVNNIPPRLRRDPPLLAPARTQCLARIPKLPTGITLEDHTADPECETSRGLWARSVSIDDHCVVKGKTGVGAYVVWNCTVHTLDGGPMVVRLRYSEFDELRQRLDSSFPHARNALPALPPKSVLFKFRPEFLENRRVGLEYFLNCILLNPEFSSSPIVKDFLFGRMK